MYAYIKGKLEYKHSDHMVVEAGNIGYRIMTSQPSLDAAGAVGNEIKVYTHLHVREDVMMLFGFLTKEELGMFELLITVSGVGPKAALSLISSIPPSKFGLAVITDDSKSLTKAPGVGSKIAQRIILELKDKIKKERIAVTGASEEQWGQTGKDSKLNEAINALMVLGYSSFEASQAVACAYSEDLDIENIIKNSLKGLFRA